MTSDGSGRAIWWLSLRPECDGDEIHQVEVECSSRFSIYDQTTGKCQILWLNGLHISRPKCRHASDVEAGCVLSQCEITTHYLCGRTTSCLDKNYSMSGWITQFWRNTALPEETLHVWTDNSLFGWSNDCGWSTFCVDGVLFLNRVLSRNGVFRVWKEVMFILTKFYLPDEALSVWTECGLLERRLWRPWMIITTMGAANHEILQNA